LLSDVSKGKPVIFVLDNPGLELHADGQRDIKRVLEEKLPSNAQVIYVTHSPAMIDPFSLDQIRSVELKPDVGTRITKLAFKSGTDLDLLEPVRSAVGASIATSLVMNDFNVLVEGAADKPILEGAFKRFNEERSKKILVNGSLSESPDAFLVRFFDRAKLPFVIYVDADAAGRDIATTMKRLGIAVEKILFLNKVMTVEKGRDAELEDFISTETYHKAVEETYPGLDTPAPQQLEGKRTKYYEKQFEDRHKIGFSKRRVGERVKKLLLENRSDEETNKNLSAISSALLGALDAQVSPRKTKAEPAGEVTKEAQSE
jgi:predicted ATP-dependent endonuclease of OLD family